MVPTLMTNREEGNSEMNWGKFNSGYVNRRSRPYYFRKCKSKSSFTNIDSFPDELVFQILLELPAQDIYDSAMLVCKKWYKMIRSRNFINAHLRHSTPGLVIQYYLFPEQYSVFVVMQQGRIEMSRLTYKFKGRVWASCDGLIVEPDSDKTYSPYITNPATKQRLALPPVSRQTVTDYYSVIAYDATSMHYKVVLNYSCSDKSLPIHDCAILTVGVDKSWRRVRIKHINLRARVQFICVPLITEGFIHWTHSNGMHVVTLNVETEVMTTTLVPQGYGQRMKYYLSAGRSLTLLVEQSEFSWEFLTMKSETGEWTKLPKIDLEPQKGKVGNFVREYPGSHNIPVGWLNYGEVLVLHFSPSRVCVLYNVRTREIDSFELDYGCYYSCIDHRNSLVPLGPPA